MKSFSADPLIDPARHVRRPDGRTHPDTPRQRLRRGTQVGRKIGSLTKGTKLAASNCQSGSALDSDMPAVSRSGARTSEEEMDMKLSALVLSLYLGTCSTAFAASRNSSGAVTVTRTFDAAAEETLFYPRLVGG